MTAVDHAQVAALLRDAQETRVPVRPPSETATLTVEDAYRIQALGIERRVDAGAAVIGRKIGLTSRAMQDMLGVDEPDFGTLLDDMLVADGGTAGLDRLLQPRAEAEIAFVLGSDVVGTGWTAASVADAIDGARAAIEIIDSRVADWKITLVDTVADNASSGMFVLGAETTPLDELDLRFEAMVLSNGADVVDSGAGGAVLGDPLRCVAWLANTLGALGVEMKAGEVILSGALHRAVPVTAGDSLRAEFGRLGTVAVSFAETA